MAASKERYSDRTESLEGRLDILLLPMRKCAPRHDYALSWAMGTKSGEILKVDTGSFCPALHRLERKGWIAAEWKALEHRPSLRIDYLRLVSEKLNLTPEQQAKIKITTEEQLAPMQSIREDVSLPTKDKMSKTRSGREASPPKIRDFLNDIREKEFEQMGQDKRERTKERQERGGDCSMICNVLDHE